MSDIPNLEFLLDWQAAEFAAVTHMKSLGFLDARPTASGADGGLDATSSDAAAQVKFYASPVGRPDIQRLRGAAQGFRLPLFYSTGGYTNEAINYASEAGVALFVMDPYGGCEAISELAVLLTTPALVDDRRARMQQLQADQYRLAAAALENHLELFRQFGKQDLLGLEESAIYTHVFDETRDLTATFRAAVEAHDFERAESVFAALKTRAHLLVWLTGPDLLDQFETIEDAVQSGWETDASPGSEYLLIRASSSIVRYIKTIKEALGIWDEAFQVTPAFVDDTTIRLSGVLADVGEDPAIVSEALAADLIRSIRAGIERSATEANNVTLDIIGSLQRMNIEPRATVSSALRMKNMSTQILAQLGAATT